MASLSFFRDLEPVPSQFPCKNCGAMLEFAPGTRSLKCQYCGVLNEIAASHAVIEELDYAQQLLRLSETQPMTDAVVTHCDGCGAQTTLDPTQAAGECPFCGRAIVATRQVKKLIKPLSLLPFSIGRADARRRYDTWLESLWFAPTGLKRHADTAGLNGMYLPAWTYDCRTFSIYTGERGDHYYETQHFTALENGRRVTRTRQVRKTRWRYAGGSVQGPFDDVLVLADRSLPGDLRDRLREWDLSALTPYQDAYLSGFGAETYQIELPEGFEQAKHIMDGIIRAWVRRDIGGDEQRIHTLHTEHTDITFKHVLLPVWISAYRYRGRTFRFVINGRNGQVFGQRPWSAWKITAAVAAALALVAIIMLLMSLSR